MSQNTVNTPKISVEGARIIAVQMLVAKTIRSNPVQAVRIIMDNKQMFPTIDENGLIAHYGITSEQLDSCQSVKI